MSKCARVGDREMAQQLRTSPNSNNKPEVTQAQRNLIPSFGPYTHVCKHLHKHTRVCVCANTHIKLNGKCAWVGGEPWQISGLELGF